MSESRRIFKYPIVMKDLNRIEMPKGAEVLSVHVQNGAPQIWALVEPDNVKETRHFFVIGTGNPIPEGIGRFIGTFQMLNGSLVWHLFESA